MLDRAGANTEFLIRYDLGFLSAEQDWDEVEYLLLITRIHAIVDFFV